MVNLKLAIDDLYVAFADAAVPQHIDGCPCCIDGKRIGQLLASPVREISPEDLAPYAASALLTVGDIADYLYFLPRIMEVTVYEPSWWPDIEVTAKRIQMTKHETWPVARQTALRNVLDTVIESFMASGEFWQLDSWLCAIAILNFDVQPFLAAIETDPAAVLHYFEDNERCLRDGRLCNAFWELPNAGHDTIVRWFNSEPIRRIPSEAYGYTFPKSR
jgi:hypothetical protein